MKGRCKNIPEQIYPFFRALQPYKGGNDLLWALNDVCVRDKHKLLTATGTAAWRHHARFEGTAVFSMPADHIWDRTKQEMVLLTVRPEGIGQYDFKFTLFIAFNEIPVIDGQPVDTVLNKMTSIVEGVLLGIEAECRRLGYV
jgi:hypothetical protein